MPGINLHAQRKWNPCWGFIICQQFCLSIKVIVSHLNETCCTNPSLQLCIHLSIYEEVFRIKETDELTVSVYSAGTRWLNTEETKRLKRRQQILFSHIKCSLLPYTHTHTFTPLQQQFLKPHDQMHATHNSRKQLLEFHNTVISWQELNWTSSIKLNRKDNMKD